MKNLLKILLLAWSINFTYAYAGSCSQVDWHVYIDDHKANIAQDIDFNLYKVSSPLALTTLTVNIDFGDGSSPVLLPSSGAIVTHSYSAAGFYNLTVMATNADGCEEVKSYQIVVNDNSCLAESTNLLPGSDPTRPCHDDLETYSVDAPPAPFTVVKYIWNMGDGTFINSTSSSINYAYLKGGTYSRSVVIHMLNGSSEDCYFLVEAGFPQTVPGTSSTDMLFEVLELNPSFTISPFPIDPGEDPDFTYTGYSWPYNYEPGWPRYVFLKNDVLVGSEALQPSTGSSFYDEINILEGIYCYKFVLYGLQQTCQTEYEKCVYVSNTPCDTCNSFKPIVGKRYWISAWVQVEEPNQVQSYNDVSIDVDFTGSGSATVTLSPEGEIIDGWQRIAGDFTIPTGTYDLDLTFNAGGYATYFDDIRIHPFNSSMKSYVYDGETFWLTAELDDNNYATFYEYDQEGGLIRIKKETARGIVTIQETRSGTIKE
ncbi:MAG: PKD domain-containing protein [Crocinitomicaceae bacterium]|nr:PKD domain-containing protein [Crocinitomicaceae bacterium]